MPAMIRWPGLVPPRIEINDIFSAEDWATTLVAAAGEPDIKNKLLQGYDAAGKSFRVHLDGYDQRDLLPISKNPLELFHCLRDTNTLNSATFSQSCLDNNLLLPPHFASRRPRGSRPRHITHPNTAKLTSADIPSAYTLCNNWIIWQKRLRTHGCTYKPPRLGHVRKPLNLHGNQPSLR